MEVRQPEECVEEQRSVEGAGERDVVWPVVRDFLRSRISRHLGLSDAESLDDLVQESLVRLLRVLRRERARNLEALMTEIAKRTYVDFVRRRRVQRAWFEPLGDSTEQVSDPDAKVAVEIGDPVRRVRFIVLEFFENRHAQCLKLAQAFFADREWVEIAAERNSRPEAIRQQWLRCMGLLRLKAKHDKGLLRAWAQVTS